ncbi:MAG: molecular chaperone HtpG [Clostridia bacterium]|nr:molecular chaperone HtpG [Clostridia bacterium]
MKSFKTESKKILDLMINSIYTHKEIFLRELISNCSDAIDKLYYKSLTENIGDISRGDFRIEIFADKENRTLKIRDNGIGMTKEDLENNLGVIAKSGSQDFKANAEKNDNVNIIGQFGVGFYSAFMVSDKVEVLSKAYGSDEAYKWVSSGAEGYDVKPAEKDGYGTEITLYIKKDTEDEDYSAFLEEYRIRSLVRKYSDYIRYPIMMEVTKYRPSEEEGKPSEKYSEVETLNSMVPLWKKNKAEIKDEEYNEFYKNLFYDGEDPLKVIHYSTEGVVDYRALLFVPARAPFDYYTKNFEKGLKLYTNGVLITERCADLLPDYFSFVKGVVDSELTLNISRETIQQDKQLKAIGKSIEKKIKGELSSLLENDRETYEKFWNAFGLQIKYGVYSDWGAHKEGLKDLLMFWSAKQDKKITLKEYVDAMPEGQKYIYYGTAKTAEGVKALPQTEAVIDAGYDVLCFTDEIDEFCIKMLGAFSEKEFRNAAGDDTGIETKEENAEENKEISDYIKECLGDRIAEVKITGRLKNHPVCLSSKGAVSIEMEKVLNSMPNAEANKVTAQKVLEINSTHPVFEKVKNLYDGDRERLKDLAYILLVQAQLIEGLPIEDPTDYADKVCKFIS